MSIGLFGHARVRGHNVSTACPDERCYLAAVLAFCLSFNR